MSNNLVFLSIRKGKKVVGPIFFLFFFFCLNFNLGSNAQKLKSAATAPRQAKQAFVLARIEQLVPVLSDKCIRDWVWGVCYP
jgi:hypothetical protein